MKKAKKKVTVYLSTQLHEEFKELCAEHDTQMSPKLVELAKVWVKKEGKK